MFNTKLLMQIKSFSYFSGIPMGPYTLQDGIWGFQEIQQAFHNDSLTLPDATPKQWKITRDDCHNAPYAGKWFIPPVFYIDSTSSLN